MSRTIDDYDMGQLLGKGGFATVYRARSRINMEEVAMKIIDKERMVELKMADRIISEVRIQKSLAHESIVRLLDYFEDEKCVYMILELCSNGNIYKYLKCNGPLLESSAAKIIHQLLIALQYMQCKGIIHRDLKLSNILFDDNMNIKICDFGLAIQIAHPDEEHYTLCGTPNYIAPEIAAQQSHSFPADLWSVGCLFYSIVTGYAPFEEVEINDTLQRVLNGEYSIPDHLSNDAQDFIKCLLQTDPSQRANVHEILEHSFLKRYPPTEVNSLQLEHINVRKQPKRRPSSASTSNSTSSLCSSIRDISSQHQSGYNGGNKSKITTSPTTPFSSPDVVTAMISPSIRRVDSTDLNMHTTPSHSTDRNRSTHIAIRTTTSTSSSYQSPHGNNNINIHTSFVDNNSSSGNYMNSSQNKQQSSQQQMLSSSSHSPLPLPNTYNVLRASCPTLPVPVSISVASKQSKYFINNGNNNSNKNSNSNINSSTSYDNNSHSYKSFESSNSLKYSNSNNIDINSDSIPSTTSHAAKKILSTPVLSQSLSNISLPHRIGRRNHTSTSTGATSTCSCSRSCDMNVEMESGVRFGEYDVEADVDVEFGHHPGSYEDSISCLDMSRSSSCLSGQNNNSNNRNHPIDERTNDAHDYNRHHPRRNKNTNNTNITSNSTCNNNNSVNNGRYLYGGDGDVSLDLDLDDYDQSSSRYSLDMSRSSLESLPPQDHNHHYNQNHYATSKGSGNGSGNCSDNVGSRVGPYTETIDTAGIGIGSGSGSGTYMNRNKSTREAGGGRGVGSDGIHGSGRNNMIISTHNSEDKSTHHNQLQRQQNKHQQQQQHPHMLWNIAAKSLPSFKYTSSKGHLLIVNTHGDVLYCMKIRINNDLLVLHRFVVYSNKPLHIYMTRLTPEMEVEVKNFNRTYGISLSSSSITGIQYEHLFDVKNSTKSYRINNLPKSIQQIYSRVNRLLDTVRTKIPKLILYLSTSSSSTTTNKNEKAPKIIHKDDNSHNSTSTSTMRSYSESVTHCKCMLMSNTPLPDFHVQWKDECSRSMSYMDGSIYTNNSRSTSTTHETTISTNNSKANYSKNNHNNHHNKNPNFYTNTNTDVNNDNDKENELCSKFHWESSNSPFSFPSNNMSMDWTESAPNEIKNYLYIAQEAMRRCLAEDKDSSRVIFEADNNSSSNSNNRDHNPRVIISIL
eukprot:gene6484-13089_t